MLLVNFFLLILQFSSYREPENAWMEGKFYELRYFAVISFAFLAHVRHPRPPDCKRTDPQAETLLSQCFEIYV
jgi:hypothetical protein